MDAQRRAQVLEGLYREIRREHEQVAGQRLDTVKEQAQAVHDSIQALKVGGAKPSESSMVQRIEALEAALRRIIGLTAHDPKTTRPDAFANLNRIAGTAQSALDGPPDPERDRETTAEVLKP